MPTHIGSRPAGWSLYDAVASAHRVLDCLVLFCCLTVPDAMARDIDESTVQSPAAYMLFYRRRNRADSGAAARTIPEVLSTETGEAGVVANMSARPRENMAGRGRVGPCDFGGAADLELLSGTDRDSSPVEACATRHEVAANLGSQEC